MGVKLLGKIKIHEIAKKLGLGSKEVLEAANKLKIDVKSHLSGVDEEEAKKIENAEQNIEQLIEFVKTLNLKIGTKFDIRKANLLYSKQNNE